MAEDRSGADGGDGGDATTASAVVDPTSTTADTPAESSTGQTPTSTDPEEEVAPNGLLLAALSSGQISMLDLRSGAKTFVEVPAGLPGCGLDVEASAEGIEVGTDPFGGAQTAYFAPWSEGEGVQRTRSEPEASPVASVRAPSGWTVEVRSDGGPVEMRIIDVAGHEKSVRLLDREGLYAQLHGFDGRLTVVRLEPGEPVCDRGVVVLIDLADGSVVACGGPDALLMVTGSSPSVGPIRPPEPDAVDYENCRTRSTSDLAAALEGLTGL